MGRHLPRRPGLVVVPKGTTKGDPRMGSGLRMGIQTWPGNEFQPILTDLTDS